MDISHVSTDQKPTMYRNLYDNVAPDTQKIMKIK